MPITLYSRTTCGPCKTVKLFLTRRGISFVEKNIDDPDNALEFARVSDFPMVPLVLVGDQKVHGMNLGLLAQILTT